MVVSSLQYGEKTAFSPVFPLAGFMAEAFCWLFPWNVIEKGINLFLWHSLYSTLILHRGQQRPEGTVLPEIQSVAELTQKGRFKGLDQMPASGTHAGVTDNEPPKMILFPSISAEGFSKSTAISDTLHAVVREARVAVFDNSHSCLPTMRCD